MFRDAQEVAVLGAGLMGTCIAGELAYHGLRVKVYDRSSQALERANNVLEEHKEQLRREEMMITRNFVGTVTFTEDLENAVRSASFIFEAVFEDLNVKQNLFESVSRICRQGTIISSNTIQLDVSKIASKAGSPERCIGIRFLYPVYGIPEVEITLARQTSQDSIQKVRQLLEGMGKTLFFRSGNTPLVLSHAQVEARKRAHRDRLRALLQDGHAPHVQVPSLGHGGVDLPLGHQVDNAANVASVHHPQQAEGPQTECVVCMDSARDSLLVPCHHLCVCSTCADTLKDNQGLDSARPFSHRTLCCFSLQSLPLESPLDGLRETGLLVVYHCSVHGNSYRQVPCDFISFTMARNINGINYLNCFKNLCK